MSQENDVEIVRRIYLGWAQGDFRTGLELFDSEMEFESFMPDANERVVASGHEGVEDFMRDFLVQWRDYRIVADEFKTVGQSCVLVTGRQIGVGRQSGIAVEGPAYTVWTFRGGKIVRLLFETDRRRALEAAGLRK
jgi:ketosteroid isomerase-like protein